MKRRRNHQGTSALVGFGRPQQGRAFTIIEVLTVLATISLLAALLWPAIQQAGWHARAVTCRGQLHQWGLGFALFVEEQPTSLLNATNAVWDSFWRPYCEREKGLFVCPMARRDEVNTDDLLRKYSAAKGCTLGDKFKAWKIITRTPATLEPGPLVGSYGVNYCGPSFLDLRVNRGRKIDRANVPVFLDCVDFFAQAKATDEPPAYDGHLTSPGDMKRCCIDRHSGGINSLFLDWSVRKVGLKELWTLYWSPWFDRRGPWTKAGGVQSSDWPAWMRGFRDY